MTTAITEIGLRIFNEAAWASYYGSTDKLYPEINEILMSACPFYKGKRVRDTHFVFIGMPIFYGGDPLTVAKWLEIHSVDGQPKFHFNTNPWHVGQPHTDLATLELQFYLMLQNIVPGSTTKTPEQQVAMLPPEYEVPSTIAEVTKDILFFRRTGKRCNQRCWAACSERTVWTERVKANEVSCVGNFDEDGLVVDRWDGGPNNLIGVGASRKLTLKT